MRRRLRHAENTPDGEFIRLHPASAPAHAGTRAHLTLYTFSFASVQWVTMSNLTDTEVLRAPKDMSSGGFLSKITRSPSRKHKTQPSIPPPGIDVPFLGPNIPPNASL